MPLVLAPTGGAGRAAARTARSRSPGPRAPPGSPQCLATRSTRSPEEVGCRGDRARCGSSSTRRADRAVTEDPAAPASPPLGFRRVVVTIDLVVLGDAAAPGAGTSADERDRRMGASGMTWDELELGRARRRGPAGGPSRACSVAEDAARGRGARAPRRCVVVATTAAASSPACVPDRGRRCGRSPPSSRARCRVARRRRHPQRRGRLPRARARRRCGDRSGGRYAWGLAAGARRRSCARPLVDDFAADLRTTLALLGCATRRVAGRTSSLASRSVIAAGRNGRSSGEKRGKPRYLRGVHKMSAFAGLGSGAPLPRSA